MSDDLIELVADDLGRDVKVMTKEEENSFSFYDNPEDLKPRSPVVTVMGHVDHGKTSLLDAIRHTGVASHEAGGITQAIGASQVTISNRQITFVDTPGHEAFTAMRARGAKITDVVVLVVAADDGVMPQTVEAINHSKAAGVPIVVAINKVRQARCEPGPRAPGNSPVRRHPPRVGRPEHVRQRVRPPEEGIDDLLETILLPADVLELKANPDTFASGYIIEPSWTAVAASGHRALVNRGTLRVGDSLVAGMSYGRVRMLDQRQPGQGGRPLGRRGDPRPVLRARRRRRVPRLRGRARRARPRGPALAQGAHRAEQGQARHAGDPVLHHERHTDVAELNLIVKADVRAPSRPSRRAGQDGPVEVRITIHSAVGAITETVTLATAASTPSIIGFGVRPHAKAATSPSRRRADQDVLHHLQGPRGHRRRPRRPAQSPPRRRSDRLRRGPHTFRVPKVGTIAGCMVTEGEIANSDSVRVVRDGVVIFAAPSPPCATSRTTSRASRRAECGLGIEKFPGHQGGRHPRGLQVVEVARTEGRPVVKQTPATRRTEQSDARERSSATSCCSRSPTRASTS